MGAFLKAVKHIHAQDFNVNAIQHEVHTAFLPNCVPSDFTSEQKLEHQGITNAICYFDGCINHTICVVTIATQRLPQQKQLVISNNNGIVVLQPPSRKHPVNTGPCDYCIAIPNPRDQANIF